MQVDKKEHQDYDCATIKTHKKQNVSARQLFFTGAYNNARFLTRSRQRGVCKYWLDGREKQTCGGCAPILMTILHPVFSPPRVDLRTPLKTQAYFTTLL